MIPFLAVDRDVVVAKLLEITARKLVIRTFRFLQTQDVGSRVFKEALYEPRAKSDGVDVPGGDGQAQSGSPSLPLGVEFCDLSSKCR